MLLADEPTSGLGPQTTASILTLLAAATSRELETDIAVLAGLIETVGGERAGRVTVRIERPLPAHRIEQAFAARGIHASQGVAHEPAIPTPDSTLVGSVA